MNPPITDPWMAPEATATDKPFYGHAADVYGFGLIAIYLRSVHVFTKQFYPSNLPLKFTSTIYG